MIFLELSIRLLGAVLVGISILSGGGNNPEVEARRRHRNKWLGLLGAVFLLVSGGLQLLAHYWPR